MDEALWKSFPWAQFPISFFSATSKPFFLRKHNPLIYFNMDKELKKEQILCSMQKKAIMLSHICKTREGEICNCCSQMRTKLDFYIFWRQCEWNLSMHYNARAWLLSIAKCFLTGPDQESTFKSLSYWVCSYTVAIQ